MGFPIFSHKHGSSTPNKNPTVFPIFSHKHGSSNPNQNPTVFPIFSHISLGFPMGFPTKTPQSFNSQRIRHCGQQAGRPCSPAAHHQHPALAQLGPRAGGVEGNMRGTFFSPERHQIWVNYNDLTVLPHWESWFRYRGIIPKWPQDSD